MNAALGFAATLERVAAMFHATRWLAHEACRRVLHYVYGTHFGALPRLRRFKKKFGFLPHRVEWRLSVQVGRVTQHHDDDA